MFYDVFDVLDSVAHQRRPGLHVARPQPVDRRREHRTAAARPGGQRHRRLHSNLLDRYLTSLPRHVQLFFVVFFCSTPIFFSCRLLDRFCRVAFFFFFLLFLSFADRYQRPGGRGGLFEFETCSDGLVVVVVVVVGGFVLRLSVGGGTPTLWAAIDGGRLMDPAARHRINRPSCRATTIWRSTAFFFILV